MLAVLPVKLPVIELAGIWATLARVTKLAPLSVGVPATVPDRVAPAIAGVVIEGEVANTAEPVPVSSVIAPLRLVEEGVAKKVATPAPSPLIPVDTGRPVALVRVPEAGVPRIGAVSVCCPTQVLALFRLREATTLPVVGAIVKVVSELDTALTAPAVCQDTSKLVLLALPNT